MQIFGVIIFFKLCTIQQKTVKPTYLCPVGARKLPQAVSCPFPSASKRWLHRKFARFVLFLLIKKRSLNLLCVLDLSTKTIDLHWNRAPELVWHMLLLIFPVLTDLASWVLSQLTLCVLCQLTLLHTVTICARHACSVNGRCCTQ